MTCEKCNKTLAGKSSYTESGFKKKKKEQCCYLPELKQTMDCCCHGDKNKNGGVQ